MNETEKNIKPENPYRGIHPFEYIHRSLFFGREEELTQLLSNILFSRFVLLFGESGSGKSSLINAGLIPKLFEEGFNVEKLRIRPIISEPLVIKRININTEEDPRYLPSAFCTKEIESENNLLDSIPCNIENFVKVIREHSLKKKTVLIFDQFEELFTLLSISDDIPEKKAGLRDEILNLIYEIANDKILPVKIIILIREDFLGELEALSKNYPQVFNHRIRLRKLDEKSAKKAILGPFTNQNYFQSVLDERLADEIIYDLLSEKKDNLVHPTHLQIVCSRLWDKYNGIKQVIESEDYIELGAVKGILEGFLKTEIDKAAEIGLKDECVLILGNLITEAETRDVVSLEKLLGVIEVENEKINDALNLLVNQKLINRTSQRETFYYEVASEYLIPPILKEADQLKRKKELMEERKKAEEKATQREKEFAEEREKKAQQKYTKRLKTFLVILSLAFIGAVIAMYEIIILRDEAELQKIKLAFEKTRAEQIADTAKFEADRANKLKARADSVALIAEIKNDSLNIAVDSVASKIRLAEYQKNKAKENEKRATEYAQKTVTLIDYQRKTSNSRELALKALTLKDENPELATKLALYALGELDANYALPTNEAESALQNIWYINYPLLVQAFHDQVTSIAINPVDDKSIAFSGIDGRVLICDYEEMNSDEILGQSIKINKVFEILEHKDLVEDIAFSRDGRFLVTGCRDGKVRIWDIQVHIGENIVCEQNSSVRAVAVCNNNKWIASGGEDGIVKVWNFEDGKLIKTLPQRTRSVSTLNFSPDNFKLAAAGWDNVVNVWNTETWEKIYTLDNGSPLKCVVFSPDGKHIVTTSFERIVKYWNAETGQREKWLVGHDAAVTSVVFYSSSDRLVSSSFDKSVIVWDIETGGVIWKIEEEGRIGDISLSSSGKRLAVANIDNNSIHIYYMDINELVDSVKINMGRSIYLSEEDKNKFIR